MLNNKFPFYNINRTYSFIGGANEITNGPIGPIGLIEQTAGFTGLIGCTGPEGCMGLIKCNGPTGCTGLIGCTGPTDCTGLMKCTGPTGCTGLIGCTGPTGCTGLIGCTGPTGCIRDKDTSKDNIMKTILLVLSVIVQLSILVIFGYFVFIKYKCYQY